VAVGDRDGEWLVGGEWEAVGGAVGVAGVEESGGCDGDEQTVAARWCCWCGEVAGEVDDDVGGGFGVGKCGYFK
jgi:hypothetical protein